MADIKISALGAIASVAGEDLVAIIDDPSGTPASRKATITQIATFLASDSTTRTADLDMGNLNIDDINSLYLSEKPIKSAVNFLSIARTGTPKPAALPKGD